MPPIYQQPLHGRSGLALAPRPGGPGRKVHLDLAVVLALAAVLDPFELVSVLCAVACA
jgi:hypothetical protein